MSSYKTMKMNYPWDGRTRKMFYFHHERWKIKQPYWRGCSLWERPMLRFSYKGWKQARLYADNLMYSRWDSY